ncbi:MAG: F0F1 ATP synthase subunit epsilon [Acidobacteria bacterium]|nr:F0F1 ATP synthase subunit epsilon [Acidobacteriota bacterium]
MAEDLPKSIHLTIVTPDRLLFNGEVDAVTVPGLRGYLGILPGHAPLLSELRVGMISLVQEGRENHLFCTWGFVEVLPDRVSVLVEQAELPEEIDPEKAKVEKERAELLLRSKDPKTNYEQALFALEEAVNRIQVASRRTA